LKHPAAELKPDPFNPNEIPHKWFTALDASYVFGGDSLLNALTLSNFQGLLRFSFWMHNARGFSGENPEFMLQEKEDTKFLKKNLADECFHFLHRFFSTQRLPKGLMQESIHPAFVRCPLVCKVHLPFLILFVQMAMVLFDRMGDKLIEDQSAQIFSGSY
jgi:hypothetical protein